MKIGLNTAQGPQTGWDWVFSRVPDGGVWVKVALTDGKHVVGLFGPNSKASGDSEHRDIYLEEVTGGDDWYTPPPDKSRSIGMYIPLDPIGHIDFWYPREQANRS